MRKIWRLVRATGIIVFCLLGIPAFMLGVAYWLGNKIVLVFDLSNIDFTAKQWIGLVVLALISVGCFEVSRLYFSSMWDHVVKSFNEGRLRVKLKEDMEEAMKAYEPKAP